SPRALRPWNGRSIRRMAIAGPWYATTSATFSRSRTGRTAIVVPARRHIGRRGAIHHPDKCVPNSMSFKLAARYARFKVFRAFREGTVVGVGYADTPGPSIEERQMASTAT